jgi:Uma2 family endonuclease
MISVDEYLNTAYDPDVEFVDGVLVERRTGEWLHSLVQSNVLFALRRKYPHLKVVAELRIERELFSPRRKLAISSTEGDVMSAAIERLKEFARKGVPNIWLIDPRLQLLWTFSPPMLVEIEGESISSSGGSVELTRDEIFSE